jgi:large subunit ribosomal protein L29
VKSRDRLNKLKDLSDEELEDQRIQLAEERFRLRFQWTMGQSEALRKLREVRRDRARVLTLLRTREIERKRGA